MEKSEEVGYDVFDLIGDEYLIAIELNLIAMDVNILLDAREIEHAREVERIVNVEMNPEKRIICHGVELVVELLVVFILQLRGSLGPKRSGVVHDIVFLCFHFLTILPSCFLTEGNGYGEETAVLGEQFLNLVFLEEFLAVVGNVENDVGASVFLFAVIDFESRRSVASPFHAVCTLLVATCYDVNTVSHHE